MSRHVATKKKKYCLQYVIAGNTPCPERKRVGGDEVEEGGKGEKRQTERVTNWQGKRKRQKKAREKGNEGRQRGSKKI